MFTCGLHFCLSDKFYQLTFFSRFVSIEFFFCLIARHLTTRILEKCLLYFFYYLYQWKQPEFDDVNLKLKSIEKKKKNPKWVVDRSVWCVSFNKLYAKKSINLILWLKKQNPKQREKYIYVECDNHHIIVALKVSECLFIRVWYTTHTPPSERSTNE